MKTLHTVLNEAKAEFRANFLNDNGISEEEYLELFAHKILEAVRSEVVGMVIEKPKCYCKTYPEHNCAFTSNEAIDDVLKHLSKFEGKV